MNPIPKLKPGDHLLYRGVVWYDHIIAIKTWSEVVHIEVYEGNGNSLASRNGIGVDRYPLRISELAYVLRPNSWNQSAATEWFEKRARGQAYDWKGLLCFTLAVRQGSPKKMFCSEFSKRLDVAAGCWSFHPLFKADRIAPGNYLMSPEFQWIFRG